MYHSSAGPARAAGAWPGAPSIQNTRYPQERGGRGITNIRSNTAGPRCTTPSYYNTSTPTRAWKPCGRSLPASHTHRWWQCHGPRLWGPWGPENDFWFSGMYVTHSVLVHGTLIQIQNLLERNTAQTRGPKIDNVAQRRWRGPKVFGKVA